MSSLRSPSASVLLVDDTASNLVGLEAVLRPLGYRMVTAVSGREALKRILEEDFSCILLDVQMPALDGFETARLIRTRDRCRWVPLVFITGVRSEEADIRQGFEEGAVDYVLKPFHPDVLRGKVAALVQAYERENASRAEAARLRQRSERDAAQRLEIERTAMLRVQAERERLYSVFMQAPFAVLVLRGPDHVFELVNRKALAFVGFRDVLGRPAREAVPELGPQGYFEILDRVYRTGQPFIGDELPASFDRGNDGKLVPGFFNFVYQPLLGEGGLPEGVLVSGFEVTQQVRAREAAEHAVQLRDEFLAVASHELKTPLTPLLMRIDGLLQEAQSGAAVPPRTAQSLAAAHRQVKRLAVLVDGLLDVARIGKGDLELELKEDVDLAAILRDCVVRFEPHAQSAGAAFRLEVPQSVVGRWDPLRLEQVANNLVSNALKYGNRSPVTIRLAARDGVAHLQVRDEGIGIPPQAVARLFEKYERAGASRTYGGLGLGLYISKQIVAALGGRITVDSEVNRGTTFNVELPLSGPSTESAPTSSSGREHSVTRTSSTSAGLSRSDTPTAAGP